MAKSLLKEKIKNLKDHRIHDVLSYSLKKGKLTIIVNDNLPSTSVDVSGVWSPPVALKSILTWGKAFIQSVKFHWELTDSQNDFLRPFVLLKNLFDKEKSYELFKLPWTGWIWCVFSLEEEVEKFLEKKSWEIVAEKNKKGRLDYRRKDVVSKFGTQKDKVYKDLKELFDQKDEDFVSYMLEERGLEPSGFLWININDPTVFVVDPRTCPFAHERGWDKYGIQSALQLWINELGIKLPVEVIDHSESNN